MPCADAVAHEMLTGQMKGKQMIGNILVGLVALVHVYIVYLEMVLWDTPRGHKTFRLTPEFASASKVLAANQGLYKFSPPA